MQVRRQAASAILGQTHWPRPLHDVRSRVPAQAAEPAKSALHESAREFSPARSRSTLSPFPVFLESFARDGRQVTGPRPAIRRIEPLALHKRMKFLEHPRRASDESVPTGPIHGAGKQFKTEAFN